MPLADIIQIVLSALSLMATIWVSYSIYWLQTKHEKELRETELSQQRRAMEEQAIQFMIDNSDELNYLPLCVVAANVARLKKHARQIYSNFCRLSPEMRDEVLRQTGVRLKTGDIPTFDWVFPCIEKLQADIEAYQLGRDILYSGAKYFFRSQNYFSNEYDFDIRQVFDPIYPLCSYTAFFNATGKVNIGRYVDDYFRLVLKDSAGVLKKSTIPPIDYVWTELGANRSDEDETCGWVMALIHEITLCLWGYVYRENSSETPERESTDAQVEFYEDMYYQTLLDLFYTYYRCWDNGR